MKVYIASPFFNEEQLEIVKEIEAMLTDLNILFFSPRLEGVIKNMTKLQKAQSAERIYNKNIFELEECDTIIVVVDYKDTGTLFELGFFASLRRIHTNKNKKIITLSLEDKPVNLMLRYTIDAHAIGWKKLEAIMTVLEGRTGIQSATFDPPDINE